MANFNLNDFIFDIDAPLCVTPADEAYCAVREAFIQPATDILQYPSSLVALAIPDANIRKLVNLDDSQEVDEEAYEKALKVIGTRLFDEVAGIFGLNDEIKVGVMSSLGQKKTLEIMLNVVKLAAPKLRRKYYFTPDNYYVCGH